MILNRKPTISPVALTHCILNRLSHTIYRKSPILILGTPGYEIYIFLEKKWLNYLQTVETLIRRRVLRRLIWVCTICYLPFYGSPDYNGLSCNIYNFVGVFIFVQIWIKCLYLFELRQKYNRRLISSSSLLST